VSTRRLEVVITGDASSLNRALGGVQRDMGQVESRSRRVGSSLALLGKGGALAGVAAVGVALKIGTTEFLAQEKASARTANVLKTTGGVANVTAAQVEALASALQSQTGTADDAIQSSANLLLTFTKVRDEAGKNNDIFSQAVPLINDMSVALGTDLNGATLQVGKALNDPIKGVSALSRAGVSFTQQQRDQIRAMQESGNVMGAQKIILGELATQFGGAASAEGETTEALQQIQRAGEDMAEGFAAKVLPSVVSLVDSFKRNWPQIRATTEAAFQGAQRAASRAMAWLDANVVPTIRAIVSAARGFWARFGGDITAAFNLARRVVGNSMRGVLAIVTGVLAVLRGDWSTAWNSLKTVVKSATDSVLAILRGLPGIVFGIATDIGKSIADGVIAGLGNLAGRIASAVRGGLGAADNTPSIDLGRGGLTGRGGGGGGKGSQSADARRLFVPGGNPLSPTDVAGIIIDNLHRDDSLQDKQTRSRVEARAKRAGFTNPDEIALRGERAVLRIRKTEITANMGTVRTAVKKVNGLIARRKNKRAKAYAALAGVKGQSDAAKDKRQKIQDSIASDTRAIRDRYDELNALIRRGADLGAEAAELGFDIQGLDAEIAATPDLGTGEGPTPGDLAAAEASLTSGLGDDVAASRQQEIEAEAALAEARRGGDNAKIIAAIGRLKSAKDQTAALIDQQTAQARADNDAIENQRLNREARLEGENRAFGAFVNALRGSGTIDPSGGVTVNQYIEGSVVQDAWAASWIVSALGRQGSPSSGMVTSPA